MNPTPNPSEAGEQTVFDSARKIGDALARAAYLDAACAGDAKLRERIEKLLDAGQRADEFLEQNPLGALTLSDSPSDGAREKGRGVEEVGTIIGPYKLLEKIGEGGFGVVYMAEQKQPIKRRVALKIIKIGMDTREVVARFEAERQALAVMDHPNIAKVFDAGATGAAQSEICNLKSEISRGRPYFVMELVRGIKITDYCDEKNLSTQQRLDLFTQVCQAVQHAHQKGIIHRDLKPSNILVTVNDGVAVPKIIDFGIAKATQMELTEKTVFTRFHQFLGTPAYMSPEQAELTSVDVDTRSDIYSLGVLLYELLTGKTPFDATELLKAGLDEMRRVIREKEPERPSTRLTRELARVGGARVTKRMGSVGVPPAESGVAPDSSPAVYKSREESHSDEVFGGTPKTARETRALPEQTKKLVNLLRGDLDWIVMKCLEKDRARRYETANGLATDIQRHLSNEPVIARPPSNLYRFQKLVRRNKLAFAAGAGIAAALVIGLALALWQSVEKTRAYHRAVAAEREARDNEKTARQIGQFFEDVLAGAGPEVAKGRDATILIEILRQTADRISTELTNEPETEAYLRERIGLVHRDLGDYPSAELMQSRAVALRRQLHPNGHRDLAKALSDQAITFMLLGRFPEAESRASEALEMGKKLPSPHPEDMPAWMNTLATILKRQNKFAKAEALYREALVMNQKSFGKEHRETATTLGNLASVLAAQDKLEEAEAKQIESLEMLKKLYGDVHPLIAQNLSSLMVFLRRQGKLEEAEKVGRDAVAMLEKVHGKEHPSVAIGLGNLAVVLERRGKLDEAESKQREALAIRRNKLGPEHPLLAASLYQLGTVLNKQGKLPEAEDRLREALVMANRFPSNNYVNSTNVLADLNEVLAAQGKALEANPPNAAAPTAPTDKK
jgi:serine/threonine protein kinase/Flp pilus assembly protein TadD